MNHFKLLCDFGELNWIFTNSGDIDSFLDKIVSLVIRHIDADLCTIYLYNEETEELILKAVEGEGLSKEYIGKVRLKTGEGLAGLTLKERKLIYTNKKNEKTKIKLFPGHKGTENYGSYLSVPILRGISIIGVLSLCREKKNYFTDQDIQALKVITSQLANIIENARLFIQLEQENKRPEEQQKSILFKDHKYIKGNIASEGFALGESKILKKEKSFSLFMKLPFKGKYSLEDFKKALTETEAQLSKMQGDVEKTLDDAASLIFTSHLMMLKDPVFMNEIISLIKAGKSPPKALLTVAKKYMDLFSENKNEYVREKVQDIEDLVVRIIGNLDKDKRDLLELKNKIIIAQYLFPSDILKLSSEKVSGIIQVRGGVTSHISILSRSLRIPLIIVDMPQLMDLPDETFILMDADQGDIYINPLPNILEHFRDRNKFRWHIKEVEHGIKPETYTKDGTRVRLLSNINLLSDLKLSMKLNSEGVGLYRTEFPFLIRNDFPTEEEQFVIYKKVVDTVKGKEVSFRTLDIGGDKVHAYYKDFHEANPYLGMRSIRFSLQNQDIFKQQIRAMLLACANIKTKIMFPMISSLDEFLESKRILLECREELINEGVSFKESPQIGMMIELPSIVEIMEELSKEADFFSIGTNDFVQYILGVDRTNEKVAAFYLPHHPSVLRSLKRIVDIANKHNKEISLCGEMAHHQRYIPFLLGIGIRTFSMDAIYLYKIQNYISTLSIKKTEILANRLLKKASLASFAELFGFY